MLAPGDRVLIDGGTRVWTITAARREDDTNYYQLAGHPGEITADRITGHWVET